MGFFFLVSVIVEHVFPDLFEMKNGKQRYLVPPFPAAKFAASTIQGIFEGISW